MVEYTFTNNNIINKKQSQTSNDSVEQKNESSNTKLVPQQTTVKDKNRKLDKSKSIIC